VTYVVHNSGEQFKCQTTVDAPSMARSAKENGLPPDERDADINWRCAQSVTRPEP
jgi:hypothetical protein